MNAKIQNLSVNQVPAIGWDLEKGAEVGYLNAILNTIHAPILVLHPDLRVRTSNKAFNELFHVSTSETENRFVYKLGESHWNISALRNRLAGILSGESNLNDFEVSAHFPHIGERTMLLNAEKCNKPALKPD
jgi:two-component system CheB/CheR fusion protein